MTYTVRKHVLIYGLVQGVWFRGSTREMALRTGVSGWVRNTPDGSVEAVFEGPPYAVEDAVTWCSHGPDHALVDGIDVTDEEPEGLVSFEIRY